MKLGDLFPYWEQVRETLKESVSLLDPVSLEASPEKEIGSIGSLLRDLIFTEEFWLHQVLKGDKAVSEADYGREQLPTIEAIFRRMDAVRDSTEDYLAPLAARDLERRFVTPQGDNMSLLSILWIIFMNELHCCGQISMLLRWLGLEPVEV